MSERWVCTQCMSPSDGPECPKCRQAAAPSADIPQALPPQTILKGRYLVGGAVGGGGFGITYRALDLTQKGSDRRIVAIKEYFPRNFAERRSDLRVHPKEGKENSFVTWRDKFGKEYRMLLQLQNCDAVVDVYDVFEENSTIYLVMEFISGETLENRVKRSGPIPVPELMEYTRKLLPSLVKMHGQGLLHRDLNPSNIILTAGGMPKLIDFGSARPDPAVIAPNNGLTVLMRMGFAPPEQYKRDGRQGTWTDVYGLCATLYYAMTGTVPQESRTRLHDDKLLPPKAICAVPDKISQIIMQGLKLDISNRIPDFHKLYEAFFEAPRQSESPSSSAASSRDVHPNPPSGMHSPRSQPDKAFLRRWNAALQAAKLLQPVNRARYGRICRDLEEMQSWEYNAEMWSRMEEIILSGGILYMIIATLKARK